jgi:hypothetical protein
VPAVGTNDQSQRLLRDNNNKKETGRWLKFSRLFLDEARDAAFGCTAATTLSARVERRKAFPIVLRLVESTDREVTSLPDRLLMGLVIRTGLVQRERKE